MMLSRSCTSFGAVVGGRGGLAEECGVAEREFSEVFAELEKSGLLVADLGNRLSFIGFLSEDDPPANASVAVGRGRMLGDLPECPLRQFIAATLVRHAGKYAEELAGAAENIGGLDGCEESAKPGVARGRS